MYKEPRKKTRMEIAFVKETDGLLKIEDNLPFFPDFSLVDDFKVHVDLLLDCRLN